MPLLILLYCTVLPTFLPVYEFQTKNMSFRKSLGLLSDIDLTNICTFSNRQLKMSLYIATDLIRKTTDV